jgi:anti-sigma factor RsiW
MDERGDKLTANGERPCDCSDVAAYLDGELGVAESSSFETHLKSCAACAEALAEQQRLLRLLEAAFSRAQKRVALPADFTRIVTARAQSDMTCVRRRSEKRRALLLALALASTAFALLGTQIWGELLSPLGAVARALSAASAMMLHSFTEAASGMGLLLRGLGGYLLQAEASGARAFVLVALASAVLLLLRLITKYHRAGLPD